MNPLFIDSLLRYLRPSSGPPPVTDCGFLEVAATTPVTSLSPSPIPAVLPSGGEVMYPALCDPPTIGPTVNGQQPATIGATQGDHKQAKRTPIFSHSRHYNKTKFPATRFRFNRGQSFTTKQAIKLRSLTRKVHTLTAAFSEASRVMHKLQQQAQALAAENQTLKSVIRNMQNHLTSPSTTTQNNTHFCFTGPGQQQIPHCPEEQQERGNGLPGDNKRQANLHRIHRTAACTDICTTHKACCLQRSNDSPAENDAGRQTGSDQWLRGQHEPCHRYLASSASGRAPGCPRRDQHPDRRLGGSSHQAGPGVPWGSEPEHQRLWPSHQRR